MKFIPEHLYHIYNQGNNRQTIYYREDDYLAFLNLTGNLILPHAEIIAYCLMPNHFHFLIYSDQRSNIIVKQGGNNLDVVTNGFRKLLSGYARIINSKVNRTGSLFRQKTKSKNLTEAVTIATNNLNTQDYYFNCFHYIHQNPLKAKLVQKLEDWPYSSYRNYAGLKEDNFCNKELAKLYCSYEPSVFTKQSLDLLSDDLYTI